MKYYLAYGSNLNMAQMTHRCPDAVALYAEKLPGYQLVFRRGYLTIEKKPGAFVPVGIWSISAEDEKSLDRYEGYPKLYYKKTLQIDGLGRMAYIMQPGHPIMPPTDYYFYTVYHGYKEFGLDTQPLIEAYQRAKYDD